MKVKTQILLVFLVIFLTIGCVSAAEDNVSLSSTDTIMIGLPAPTYYNVTEDTYSDYFDENGTFTVTPSAGENSVVQIGNISNKSFIFNTPNLTITSLDEKSMINDGGITLNTGAHGSTISNLLIYRNGYDMMGIDNYASNVSIFNNNILLMGEALYDFAAIFIHDSENVIITDNIILINTSNYASGIELYANYLENETISNAVVSNNKITIINNASAYGISLDTGEELIINNNSISISSSNTRPIEAINIINSEIIENNIDAVGDSIYAIAGSNIVNCTIAKNKANLTAGNLDEAYPVGDNIPNGQSALYIIGLDNTAFENEFTGISNITSSSNIIAKNTSIIAGSGSNFTAYIVDAFGNPIIGQHVYINLTRVSSGASKVYDLTSDYTGKLTIPINLAEGLYTAKLSYNGITIDNNSFLAEESSTLSILVNDGRLVTILNVSTLNKTVDTPANFTGKLITITGQAVAGQHVFIELLRLSSGASKAYNLVTDYSGNFALPINLAKGVYIVAIAFDGTSIYAPTANIASIDVI